MADHGPGISKATRSRRATDRRDLLTAAITAAASLLVVTSGWRVVQFGIRPIGGDASPADSAMISVLLLNMALLLLGWRRLRGLKGEVARRRAAEAHAQRLATCDPLTGLLNRRALGEAGARLLDGGHSRRRPVAMLMIDLDHFKSVNDLYGHTAGDVLLRVAAEAISEALPPHAIAARLGGDEFACVFDFDPDRPETVDEVAAAIVRRIGEPTGTVDLRAQVSASMGIARTHGDCSSIEALMRRSDIALYAAKRAGRNRCLWFDASMERELAVRNRTEQDLRVAIPRGELVPYFEQLNDLATGALTGFEMLARWNHPDDGLIEPADFIAVAEESGLIGELSMSVMGMAMDEARHWHPSLLLAVNISSAQMRDPWLPQKIVKLLTETRFPPDRLEIEITEAALFENLGRAQSIIGSLKNQGIAVALDDFGTGYSSLTHLRALPLDRIKIDRSFVMTMAEDKDSASIVAAITLIGTSLNVSVTAEGVADDVIRQLLIDLGCRHGQGWHFGRPMTARQAHALLAERGLLAAAPRAAAAGEYVSERQDRLRAM
ncbi:MAG: GGDEF-domain containing protein [Rhizorhabdus sp.]|nr:GGDEF-domain containing protein [Rhizorhabdus sp.]